MSDGRDHIGETGGVSAGRQAASTMQGAALDALDDMVAMAVIDLAGQVVHVSDRWCRMTGWPREQVLGAHWKQLVFSDDLTHTIDVGRYLIQSVSASSVESRVPHADGGVTWIESQVSPLRDASGELRSWLVVATDITPHKEATEALRRSERRLQVIFDNSTDLILTVDRDGVVSTGAGSCPQLGYSDATFPREDPLSLVLPEDRAKLSGVVGHFEASGARYSDPFEVRVRAADGRTRWLEAVAVNLLDEPAVRAIVVHSRDVTGTLEALNELRTMATRLDSLVSHLTIGVLLADENGQIIFANRATTEMFGLGSDPVSMVGKTIEELREHLRGLYDDYDAALARIVEILRRREPVRDEQVQLKDGTPLARSFMPIFDDGSYRGHLWLFRDLGPEIALAAEREHLLAMEKEQNARLVAIDALRSDLVASVSHDLRTPLTSIMSFSRLLREGLHTDAVDAQLEYIDIIERNTDRIHRLVEDLLLLDHLESNAVELNVGPVDVVALLKDAVASLRPTADQRDVALHLRTEDGPALHGDVDRLGRLVDNLLSNAVKFAGAGGRVQASVAPTGSGWRLEVCDEGIGIPADEIELLFQRFYRASNARREAISGSGLGLSIAYRVAELHCGTINIESEEGVGTSVVVDLLGVPVGG